MSRKIVVTYFENVQGEMCACLGSSKAEPIAKTKLIVSTAEPAFTDQNLVNSITAKIKRCACRLFHDTPELTVDVKSLADLEKERTRQAKESEEIFKPAEISAATKATAETL